MSHLDEALGAHPFLAGLAPSQLQLLLPCASPVSFPAGQTIFRAGDEANHIYLLRSGRVALSIHRPHRGAKTIYTLSEGDVVGISWLELPQEWFFDITTLEVTRAIALEVHCLAQVCEAQPDLGCELLKRYVKVLLSKIRLLKLQLVDFYCS